MFILIPVLTNFIIIKSMYHHDTWNNSVFCILNDYFPLQIYSVCVFLAITMHYSFLAAFSWMSIMSFDIFTTFSSTVRPSSMDNHGRRFLRYSIYAWGLPLLIIIISVSINFSPIDTPQIRPGYGEGVCWITYRLALIVFFGVPVFLIITMNMVFYILTTVSICKITAATKIVSKSSDKQRLLLYTKLSTIMGLAWMFGFIATLADIPSLWYLFIILNSLQGAFICITFVCNKKTLSLLRAKYAHVTGTTLSDATKSSLLTNSKARSQSDSSESAHQVGNSVVNNYSRLASRSAEPTRL